MVIFGWSVGTQAGPTLMGRILPDLIRNRVGYGFKKKTRTGSGFYKKSGPKPRPGLGPGPIIPKLLKTPYIYRYKLTLTPSFFNSASSPSLPHFSSHLLTLTASHHTAHGLTPHTVTWTVHFTASPQFCCFFDWRTWSPSVIVEVQKSTFVVKIFEVGWTNLCIVFAY